MDAGASLLEVLLSPDTISDADAVSSGKAAALLTSRSHAL